MSYEDEDELREWPISDELRVDLDGPYVIFGDGTYASVDEDVGDVGVLPERLIRPLPLVDLDAALGALAETQEGRLDTWLIDTDPPARLYDVEPLEGIALHTGGQGELCALVDIGLPRYLDESFESRVPALLDPMVARFGARARSPWHGPEGFFPDAFLVMVKFESMTGRKVGDLLDLALDVQALLRADRVGEFNRSVARDLLRAGRANALVGKPESQWLEAKGQAWDLGSPSGKAEAAKDISALANSGGGILVIPAQTRSEAGVDVITEVKALPLERFSETQFRDTLAQWTFPPLEGIEVDVIEQGERRGQIVIVAPGCRAEHWPHLVVSGDQAAFASASVAAFVRDGSTNRALTAAQLHGLMRDRRRQTEEAEQHLPPAG